MLNIEWADQRWELLADKALHWPARRALIVADVHFGKAAAFRHHGVPVPHGGTAHDLARLSAIIGCTRCSRMIILGDFLHAPHGRDESTMLQIGQWRHEHAALDITLLRGNHDVNAGDPPVEWRIGCCDRLEIDGISLRHELPSPTGRGAGGEGRRGAGMRDGESLHPGATLTPALTRRERGYTIAGHVHPCVRLRDADGSSLRSPCFVFSRKSALLPAFGSFTGGHQVRPRQGDRVFAAGEGEVIEVEGVRA